MTGEENDVVQVEEASVVEARMAVEVTQLLVSTVTEPLLVAVPVIAMV